MHFELKLTEKVKKNAKSLPFIRSQGVSFVAETVACNLNYNFYCNNCFFFNFKLDHLVQFQGPIKTLKSVATKAVQKTTDSGVDCPLMFDDTR